MRLGLNHLARMEQRLIQSPQMIQAMQILQLSSLDLAERIDQELVENPFLEVDEGASDRAGDGEVGTDADAGADGEALSDRDRMLQEFERLREFEDGRSSVRPDTEGADRKHEAMQNAPARPKNTAAVLMDQVALLDLEGDEREAAELIVYSLDAHGYLEDGLEDLAQRWSAERRDDPDGTGALDEHGLDENGHDEAWLEERAEEAESQAGTFTPADALHALRIALGRMRRALHPAIGASNLAESLRLQLEARGLGEDDLAYDLVDSHLEDLEKNRLPHIAKETGATLDEIKDAIGILRGLDPHPTADYGDEMAETIIPDVMVEEVEGTYEVRLARRGLPSLRVSPEHKVLMKETVDRSKAVNGRDEATEARDWMRKRLESARWFVDAVAQRQNTLLSVAQAIFERQQGFLEKGVKSLAPLRMQDVADATNVHISTVSRAVAGKYVQTPRGILPLKYFFNSGTTDSAGRATSQVSIQERLKELVEQEDPTEPLSDDQLAALLLERHGVKIARRTVTKYRKALDLPSSSQRKRF
ncbi:RNA polymerase sigma-54 factor [Planctomycetes bacterium Pla163]|uniref:RNA polymerase sigma-54 factor n=1 Tax=Rohdeia mirabilis TaxID=2528008 RepID=A0A518D0D4_9BACT|nr:RNA polymerase sigma-54 factor [Planctomycetes bacterium Pla163]